MTTGKILNLNILDNTKTGWRYQLREREHSGQEQLLSALNEWK